MSSAAISFHLIDRILAFEPERSARGTLAVPPDMDEFQACLVVEAIGQLAAWVAMRRADFARRPVAARADEVRVLGTVHPGDQIDLEVSIQSCKSVAIAYRGVARVEGRAVVELGGAAGAMVPMAEFEDPEEARRRFDQLLEAGLPRRRFPERAAFAPRVVSLEIAPGRRADGRLEVASAGALYADHFPRRPVYPATLLLDAQLRIALELLDRPAGASGPADDCLVGTIVRGIKVRSFTPPGGQVDIAAEVVGAPAGIAGGRTEIEIAAMAGGKRVSSATLLV